MGIGPATQAGESAFAEELAEYRRGGKELRAPVTDRGSPWPLAPWGMGNPAQPGKGGTEMVRSRGANATRLRLLRNIGTPRIFIIASLSDKTCLVIETIIYGENRTTSQVRKCKERIFSLLSGM